MNFFAVQVMSGREDVFVELFSKTRPDINIYNIKKKVNTRKAGKPITQISCVFPGYLFFLYPEELPSPSVVYAIRRTKHFIRVLPSTRAIKALGKRDTEILHHLVSFGKEIEPSIVVFDDDKRIRVIQGPLLGFEGRIVKVNRRKKRAKIRLDMDNSPLLFDLSFEVLETLPEKES
jgi:transcription termination/antitermination protein NusG